jgi:hypothetical protein
MLIIFFISFFIMRVLFISYSIFVVKRCHHQAGKADLVHRIARQQSMAKNGSDDSTPLMARTDTSKNQGCGESMQAQSLYLVPTWK